MAENRKVIKTGIPGLDEIFRGGIKEISSILITGSPGTGKSIAAIQFIYEGAKRGEPCLYITTEESAVAIRNYAKSLGLDFEKYEKKGLITIYEHLSKESKIITIETPLKVIKQKKVKRVVLDSITLFEYLYAPKVSDYRRGILRFVQKMREVGVTLLATSERSTQNFDNYNYKAEDFLFEGLIIFAKVRKGSSFERIMTVMKMRGQDHMLDIYPFTVSKGGIKIHVQQLPFSLIEKEDISKGRF